MKKRWLAILMAVMMAISLLPTAAWAEETTDPGDVTPLAETASVLFVDPTSTNEAPDGSESSPYPSLAAAFAAADHGGTVKLLNNLEMTASVTIENKVTLDLNGKTISVAINPTTEVGMQDASTTTTPATSSAFVVTGNGYFTVKNGKIIGKSGFNNRAIEGSGTCTIALEGLTVSGFSASEHGGGLKVASMDNETYYGQGTVTISKCDFNHNSSGENGGSVYLYAVASVSISGSTFTESSSSDYGGGIYCEMYRSEIDFTKNTVSKNHAASSGGGLYIGGFETTLTFSQNLVEENVAEYRGGGLVLQLYNKDLLPPLYKNDSVCKELTGTIRNNKACWGGGIDHTFHFQIPLKLQNVLITGNTAVRGGGIWACPSSQTEIHSTLGGAIYGNTAKESFTGNLNDVPHPGPETTVTGKGPTVYASGDEIRFETNGTEDKYLSNDGDNENNTISVNRRALGGGLMEWYQDEAIKADTTVTIENRPQGLVNISNYQKKDISFGLHGELGSDHQALARSEARLIIEGNTATKRGGGIATNASIVIGQAADIDVTVEKVWPMGMSADELPSEIVIDLYRIDAEGNQVKLDHDITLNSDNNWRYIFRDLPSMYLDENGREQSYRYTAKEHPVDGWACCSAIAAKSTTSNTDETDENKQNVQYTATLTNSPGGALTVTKEVTGSGDKNKSFTFTVTAKKDNDPITSIYGGMTFNEKGTATFTLKDGESVTTSLPTGTSYTVKETDNEGYRVTMTNDTGTIEQGKTIGCVFTNHRSSGGGGGSSRPTLNTEDHFGYIIGYPVDYYTGEPTTDQTKKPVRPQGEITRAEVATIFFRMLTDESRTEYWSQESGYRDVAQGQWFNAAVSTLSKAGIISGYPDGSFRPNGSITRAEFATIAVRFFDVQYDGAHLFPDIDGHWAQDYIDQAGSAGLVNGYPDGTFGPDRSITRAEAVTLVNRTLDRHPDPAHFLSDMLVWPDNMDTSKWYYADMQEATNSHQYEMKTASDGTKYEVWTKMLPIRDWEAFEKAWSDAGSATNPGEVVNK